MPQPSACFSVARLRQDFPLISQCSTLYFDSAATTQKPEAVLRAMDQYYRQRNANVHRAAHQLSQAATAAFEQAREVVKQFLNAARPEEIVWTRGATEAINLVANTFGKQLRPGDRVLVSQLEHHANIVPWQLLAEHRGIELEVIPLTASGELDMAAFSASLCPRTRLVAVSHVSNALGTVNPVAEICRRAHAVGARVLVDGAQAVAHLPVDLQAIDCDFYVFSGHKTYGPTGIGVLYGKYALLESLPPWQGGGEMIERVSFAGNRYQPPPLRFEAGTPHIAGAIGLAAALSYLQRQDRAALRQHETHLLERITSAIDALPGLRVVGRPAARCGSLSFVAEGHHALDIGSYLDQRDIAIRTGHHCCMPLMEKLGLDGTARVSLACYNTEQEVDQLVAALRDYVDADQGEAPPAAAQEGLAAALRATRGRDQRHAMMMKAAKSPLSQNPELRQAAHLLHGCTSRVWLTHHWDADSATLQFEIDSDARIIRALIILLLEALQGHSPATILAFDFEAYFDRLGLLQQLSNSRTSGARAIVAAMQAAAKSVTGQTD